MGTKDTVTMRQVGDKVGQPRSTSTGDPAGVQEHPRRLAVSVTEAAALLGISRGLAYELVHRGELPVIQLAGDWSYRSSPWSGSSLRRVH